MIATVLVAATIVLSVACAAVSIAACMRSSQISHAASQMAPGAVQRGEEVGYDD